jgi:hypothetical protein
MINNWMVPRNKRKLHPVVDVLSLFTLQNLGDIWNNDVSRQLDFEAELERYGLKRPGVRRDRGAGGARTYEAWLYNLGLIFKDTTNGVVRTTMAGDELIEGRPPVPVITNLLLKLQYPSPYSVRSGVKINDRFQIRPFRFLLRLLSHPNIEYLTEAEIARFVITEAENETQTCFDHIVQRVLDYRRYGDAILPANFTHLYPSSKTGVRTMQDTIKALLDIANTFVNYLEYSQLVSRHGIGQVNIPEDKIQEVEAILNDGSSLHAFNRTQQFGQENFQRSFGLAPGQRRDNRNFGGQTVTDTIYRQRRVRTELLHIAGTRPIINVDAGLVEEIANRIGYTARQVEDALRGFHPDTVGVFEANYLEMAVSSREMAREFEISTTDIFEGLGFASQHVGTSPLNPDIFVESPINFSGIIDTKAYRSYSITNDHKNRMVHNYIPTYQGNHTNMEFFMYVADGFGVNIDRQLREISDDIGIQGCAITARNLLHILQRHQENPINHQHLQVLFTKNGLITLIDISNLP